MLRSCSRCLIVTLFSEQYDSIDLISSKVIISVFIAKVAGQRTCHNMHLFGCLQQNWNLVSSYVMPGSSYQLRHARLDRASIVHQDQS